MSLTVPARVMLIRNERTKQFANALDRASTTVGAGGLLPLLILAKPSDGRLAAPIFIQLAKRLRTLARAWQAQRTLYRPVSNRSINCFTVGMNPFE
jgi:hypothetical protein